MTGPYATVAKDGGIWRWECRCCETSDTRWTWSRALTAALVHLRRHTTFGFGGLR